jgi:hypothetical protein
VFGKRLRAVASRLISPFGVGLADADPIGLGDAETESARADPITNPRPKIETKTICQPARCPLGILKEKRFLEFM